MNKLVSLALTLPLLACVVGSDESTGDDTGGTGGGTGGGSGGGTGGGSGAGDNYTHITASTTWTSYDVTKQTVVDAGVTVTIAAGATVKFAGQSAIDVRGTVIVQGTKEAPVHLQSATAGNYHYGFTVGKGGTLTMDYGVQTGGGISANGGTVTVRDTNMSGASGDFLVIGGGTVVVDHSTIGIPDGADSTHCDMHFGSAPTSVKITNSNISASSYGLMLYGGTNIDLTNNNWFNNTTQIDTTPGVAGDVSGGWFDKGAPKAGPGAMLTANNLAAARIAGNGPR